MILSDPAVQGGINVNAKDLAEVFNWAPLITDLFPRISPIKIETIRPFPYGSDFHPPQTPKGMVERPILKRYPAPGAEAALDLAAPGVNRASPSLAQRMTNEDWAKLGQEHTSVFQLDMASRRHMIAKLPENMFRPAKSNQAGGTPALPSPA